MKKLSLALLALAAAAVAPAVNAQAAGDLVVRARAVYLDSANKNDAQLKTSLAGLGAGEASINNKWLPEVDFTYFVTPNIAAELILTYPQKQTLTVQGLGDVGTFKHLPPTLTAQYHFSGMGAFKPYLGAGVNYTRLMSVNLGPDLDLKKNSWGLAVQAGADYAIDKKWSVNVDVKKVQIKTDVYYKGSNVGTFKVDPTLFGLGVGYKF
jgi:outer membrane protein